MPGNPPVVSCPQTQQGWGGACGLASPASFLAMPAPPTCCANLKLQDAKSPAPPGREFVKDTECWISPDSMKSESSRLTSSPGDWRGHCRWKTQSFRKASAPPSRTFKNQVVPFCLMVSPPALFSSDFVNLSHFILEETSRHCRIIKPSFPP